MLTVNLLPPEEKKIIWTEETRRLVLFFAIISGSLLALGSILLLPSLLPLFFEKQVVNQNLTSIEESATNLKVEKVLAEGRRQKEIISSLKKLISSAPKASPLLEKILKTPAPGVNISYLTISKKGTVLTGTATTRRNLLNFEKTLRDSGIFQGISSPLSSIIRETNLDFSIQGELKPPYGL